MVKLIDILNKSLLESGTPPTDDNTIKVKQAEEDVTNIQDIKDKYLRHQGFIRQIEPHPAIRKLLEAYYRNNPTIYYLLSPSACTYCVSKSIKTACVFFDEIEKKLCFAYNPAFINKQIDGFDELIKEKKVKGWDDTHYDEDDISLDQLKKLNFLVAHEVDHVLKGDLARFGKIVGTENPTKKMHKIHNIAADAVNNQELLDTNFKLGGNLGYKFITGGMLSTDNPELFKKYDIDPKKAVIISQMSKKHPWDMLENSDTYFKWMLANEDEFDDYMNEKANENDDENNDGGDDGGDSGGEDDNEVIYRVGDPIYIPELNKYGKITSINGEDVGFDVISEEEARAMAPSSPRMGMIINIANSNIPAGPIESSLCSALKVGLNNRSRRKILIESIYTVPQAQSILINAVKGAK